MRDTSEPTGGMGGGPTREMRLGLPRPTTGVIGLIIACTVLFFVTLVTGKDESPISRWLWLVGVRGLELWRFVTFQFVHGGPRHFLFNMLALYFFGPPLERAWGTRRFLCFYLFCGIAGSLFYLALWLIWPVLGSIPLIGASGGILGCIAACAILFPEMIVLVFPIRWVTGFLVVLYILSVLWMENLADAAHLGGMAGAGLWIFVPSRLRDATRETIRKRNQGRWEANLRRQAVEQAEVDRILDKIRHEGLDSLSRRERRTLQDATRRQRRDEPF